jgi:2-hydroxy-6-oxonona-2,4-dienedioate hydrolase
MQTTKMASLNPEDIRGNVSAGGYNINYYELGTGHPLILLHGSGPGATGWSNFSPNIEALSKTHRVLAVDMPGWGQSDTETPDIGYRHPESLIAFMDALGIENAALVGNSMGGMTGITTAALYPKRVSHLITMGAPAPGVNYFDPGDGETEGMKVLMRAYREPTPANMKALVQIMCYDDAMATDDLARMRSEAALAKPSHLESFLSPRPWDSRFFDLAPVLMEMQTPALFIHGRDDRVVSFENSIRLVSLVPNSRLVVLNRCGHWTQIEHADEFNSLVADFASTSH